MNSSTSESNVKSNYLVNNLINYDQSNNPISGNPLITYQYASLTNLNYRRHTNFQYGMINLVESNGMYETELDTIKYLLIISDDINNIMCINFIFPETNEVIPISITRLKIMETTKIKQVFYNVGNKKMIKIALCDIFSLKNDYNCAFQGFINLMKNKLKIALISNSNIDKNTQVQIYGSVLDVDERNKLSKKIITNGYSKIINLPIENTSNTEKTIFRYDFDNYLRLKSHNIVIKLKSFDLIKKLDFKINDEFLSYDKNALLIYNKVYDKIIFDFDNHCLIKIPYLFGTENQIALFQMTINLEKYCNDINVYLMGNNEIYKNNVSKLISFTKCFYSEIKTLQYKNVIAGNNNINVVIDQIHLKEIIITCNKNGVLFRPIELFEINFDGSILKLTKTDCDIYQELHHKIINNDIYTIGFSLLPDDCYPVGSVNLKKLNITYKLMENCDLDIYLIGFKVYKNYLN